MGQTQDPQSADYQKKAPSPPAEELIPENELPAFHNK